MSKPGVKRKFSVPKKQIILYQPASCVSDDDHVYEKREYNYLTLPPGHPDRVSCEKIIKKSEQQQKIKRMIATLGGDKIKQARR